MLLKVKLLPHEISPFLYQSSVLLVFLSLDLYASFILLLENARQFLSWPILLLDLKSDIFHWKKLSNYRVVPQLYREVSSSKLNYKSYVDKSGYRSCIIELPSGFTLLVTLLMKLQIWNSLVKQSFFLACQNLLLSFMKAQTLLKLNRHMVDHVGSIQYILLKHGDVENTIYEHGRDSK